MIEQHPSTSAARYALRPLGAHLRAGRGPGGGRRGFCLRATNVTANAAATLPRVPVFEHDYGIPDEDELAQLVGAATPHFSHQILGRVAGFARTLPPDHPRQPELRRHIAHLEAIGGGGETGGIPRSDLPPRASLSRLGPPVDGDSGPPIPHN